MPTGARGYDRIVMMGRTDWARQKLWAKRLARNRRKTKHAVPGYLLDDWLLRHSPLYRRSRESFVALGGSFRPELLSSGRALTSAELTNLEIAYTPSEAELLWAMADPIESRNSRAFERAREHSTSLFHEQNHRILWLTLLPPPPPAGHPSLLLYFNLAEALVVMLDEALGDTLGPECAGFFYRAGILYDPGTELKRDAPSQLAWRNALHAGMYATYLALGGMPEDEARRVIARLYPEAGALGPRAVKRSFRLDRQFIERTNPVWQGRHGETARRALAKLHGPRRVAREDELLSLDPLDHRLPWLIAEKTLRAFSITSRA